MSIDQEVDILRKIPLFSNIDSAKLKLMCFASRRLTFQVGQSLCTQGEPGDSAYIIIDGNADVVVENKGPLVVAKMGRNDIIGEIAILCDVPRMVTDFPEMGVEVMRVLAHRLEVTTAQLLKAREAAK